MYVLRDYMSHLTINAHYYAGRNIACTRHMIFALPVTGYYCAFLQGDSVPASGVNGVVLVQKMETMMNLAVLAAGAVPLVITTVPMR